MTATKTELRGMAGDISGLVHGRSAHVHIATWMDRPGVSLTIGFQSAGDGERIVVHKWDDEETCSVRFIFGSFWRPKRKREGVEYGRVDDVDFTVEAITAAITTLISEY